MKKLNVLFAVGGYIRSPKGTYTICKGQLLDPLAVMLEGKKIGGGVYSDFSREFGIPNQALDVFYGALIGKPWENGWVKEHPIEANDLKNLGTGVYFMRRRAQVDARFYLDRVSDLVDKDNMKTIAVSLYVVEPTPKQRVVAGLEFYNPYPARIW